VVLKLNSFVEKKMTTTATAPAAFRGLAKQLPKSCYHIRLVSPEGDTLEVCRPSGREFSPEIELNEVYAGKSREDYAGDEIITSFEVERFYLICNAWE